MEETMITMTSALYFPGAFVHDATWFVSNPYRVGELFIIWPQDRTGNNLYVIEDANGSIGPMHCSDPDPGRGKAKSLAFSGDGSTVFMSRDDGTVWRFTMPQQLSFTDCCSAASPAGTCDPHTEVRGSRVTLPSTVQGVISIAPDPFDSGSLFAVVPSATDQNRVRHLKYGGPVPLAQNLPSGISLPGAIAADPKLSGVVYVASANGLYVGGQIFKAPTNGSVVRTYRGQT